MDFFLGHTITLIIALMVSMSESLFSLVTTVLAISSAYFPASTSLLTSLLKYEYDWLRWWMVGVSAGSRWVWRGFRRRRWYWRMLNPEVKFTASTTCHIAFNIRQDEPSYIYWVCLLMGGLSISSWLIWLVWWRIWLLVYTPVQTVTSYGLLLLRAASRPGMSFLPLLVAVSLLLLWKLREFVPHPNILGSPILTLPTLTYGFVASPAIRNASKLATRTFWLFDTGAGRHMTRDRSQFVSLQACPPVKINGIGGYIVAREVGIYRGSALSLNGTWETINIPNVLYTPDLPVDHLFSYKELRKRGGGAGLESDLFIRTGNGFQAALHFSPLGYLGFDVLPLSLVDAAKQNMTNESVFLGSSLKLHSRTKVAMSRQTFHERFGHIGVAAMPTLARCFNVELKGKFIQCETCSQVKAPRGNIADSTTSRSSAFFDRLFVDVTGPLPMSGGGNKYAVVFIDDWSRFSWVFYTRSKSSATYLVHFQTLCAAVGKVPQILRSDDEFCNKNFHNYCDRQGIQQEFTPPYSPEYNGVVERRIAILRTTAMSYLVGASLNIGQRTKLWAEAFSQANTAVNLWPTSANEKESPASRAKIAVRSPSCTFGSLFYVKNHTVTKSSMEARAQVGRYMGEAQRYPLGTVRVMMQHSNQIKITRDYSAHDRVFVAAPPTVLPSVITWCRPAATSIASFTHDDWEFLDHHVTPSPASRVGVSSTVPSFTGSITSDAASPSSAIHYRAPPTTIIDVTGDNDDAPVPPGVSASTAPPSIISAATVTGSLPSPVVSAPTTSASVGDMSISNVQPRPTPRNVDLQQAWVDTNIGRPYAATARTTRTPHDWSDCALAHATEGWVAHAAPVTRTPVFWEGFSSDTPLLRHLDLPEDLSYDQLTNRVDDPDSAVETMALLSMLGGDNIEGGDSTDILHAQASLHVVPTNARSRLHSSDAAAWRTAEESEMKAHDVNKTWNLVKLPKGSKAIGCRWVYALKLHPDGSVKRFKARLVAQGFSQVEGIDYTDTFAPVVAMTTVRMLISIAAASNWFIHQMDVETAFLQAPVNEVIYVRQAPGFSNGDPTMVYCLNKSLYGLKQSPFNWNVAIHDYLMTYCPMCPGHCECEPSKQVRWKRNLVDRCLYTMKCPHTHRKLVLTIYVDDLLLTGDWVDGIEKFKIALKQRFRIQDLGQLAHCLGFNVQYSEAGILVNQSSYIDQILTRFQMVGTYPVDTPGIGDLKAYQVPCDTPHDEVAFPYRQAVGSLLHLQVTSRPDIANAVRMLTKFVNDYNYSHVKLAKRVLRYLAATQHYGLFYKRSHDVERANNLVAYCDASYADNVESSRSTTGYVHLLNGAPIVWQSKCQKTVARSSCEAEYMAMSDATNEIVYVRHLLSDIVTVLGPTTLHVDNKSAIFIGNQVAPTKLSRHIGVRYHNVQQEIQEEKVKLQYVPTRDQLADIMTKNLGSTIFTPLRNLLLSEL